MKIRPRTALLATILMTPLVIGVSAAVGQPPGPPQLIPVPPRSALGMPVDLKPLPSSEFRGWDYLVQRLRNDGISEETVRAIYADPRMPFFGHVRFALQPKESKRMYAGLSKPEKIILARDFLAAYESTFTAAETHFKVNRFVVAAILLVETHFGKNTGRQLVINRLSRVSSVREPLNLILNHRHHLKTDPTVTLEHVDARAEYLERTFYPEVLAFLRIVEREKIDPFSLNGSIAGAFGLPQFLPSSYLRYGYDGNRDGSISLFDPHDAIWSVAHFLAGSGWAEEGPHDQHRAVIWKYNRSEPYIDTILGIADILRRPPKNSRKQRLQPSSNPKDTITAQGQDYTQRHQQ